MMRSRLDGSSASVGAAVLFLYVAAASLTGRTIGFRPVYDGFAPPAPYRWLSPPSDMRPGNRKPISAKASAPLQASGSDVLSVATSDGQAFVSLREGSVAPHGDDTSVEMKLTPVDANTLGPLASRMRFEGNAYRVDATYRPSGDSVPSFTQPQTVALTVSGPASDIQFSADGKSWTLLETRPLGGQAGLSAAMARPGYVVPAGFGAPYKTEASRGLGPLSYVALAALALGTLAIVLLIVRRGRSAS